MTKQGTKPVLRSVCRATVSVWLGVIRFLAQQMVWMESTITAIEGL
jgi:hypothetical protein